MATSPGSTVIPTLRYRDAHVAIDWVCSAFGIRRHAVCADEDAVHHAQLVHGTGMVMLGSADVADVADVAGDWGRLSAQPDEVGGRATQACCVVVDDADAHYATAKAAGAEIVLDIADQDYDGRGYACRDIEGHLWWFDTYDPWSPPAGDGAGTA